MGRSLEELSGGQGQSPCCGVVGLGEGEGHKTYKNLQRFPMPDCTLVCTFHEITKLYTIWVCAVTHMDKSVSIKGNIWICTFKKNVTKFSFFFFTFLQDKQYVSDYCTLYLLY